MRKKIHAVAVCGVLRNDDNKYLLVRHTYGSCKGKYLLPGGYIQKDELPEEAIKREFLEETNLTIEPLNIIAIRCKQNELVLFFNVKYISGNLQSDHYENDSAIFLRKSDINTIYPVTNLSKYIINNVPLDKGFVLSDYKSTNKQSLSLLYI